MLRWLMVAAVAGIVVDESLTTSDCSAGFCVNMSADEQQYPSNSTITDDEFNVMRTPAIATLPRLVRPKVLLNNDDCSTEPCCSISIPSNLVKIDADGVANVTITGMIFYKDEYIQTDSEIKVCYPNSQEFLSCSQWLLESREVILRQSDLSLVQTETNKVYPLGNYAYDAKRDNYWVCVSSDASLINEFVVSSKPYLIAACVVSDVCLLITFIIYLKSEEKVGNQKLVLLCHMVSLFLGFLMLCFRYTIDFSPMPALCETVALLTQYGLLSAFCWLSVISLFSWKQFSNFGYMVTSHEFKKSTFIYQGMFGWGFPLILCIIGPIMDAYDVNHKPELSIYCWIHDYYAELYLFYLPSGAILTVNCIFFGLTIYNIRRLTKEVHQVNPFMQKKMFRLTLKLVVVLGLCWISEVISWALGNNQKYWFIFDLINCLQGFFLFLIYVNKRDTTKKITDHVSKCWRKITGKHPPNPSGRIKMNRPLSSRTSSRATSVSSISMQSDLEIGVNEVSKI